MVSIENLHFGSTRWPKASFENGMLYAGGQGRPWLGYTATPSWRTLGDVLGDKFDLEAPGAAELALDFIRNVGLPGDYDLGRGPLPFALDGSTPASELFIRLALSFNILATTLWQPIDGNGLSEFRPVVRRDPPLPKPLSDLEDALHRHPLPVGRLVFGAAGLFGDPGLYVDCSTLDEYLWASAATHIAMQQVFARCQHCGSWFTPRRPKRALYCTPTCRAAASKAAQAAPQQEAI
ncbi:MAG: hypothetical protein ABWZ57_01285 [Mesorhizobium sp.]